MEPNSAQSGIGHQGTVATPPCWDESVRAAHDRLRRAVWAGYEREARTMPWREDPNPYWVLVSELMLQQTQVPRVLRLFGPFVQRYPSLPVLATAPFPDVLAAWQGFGYNRRAKYLHRSAAIIVSDHGGAVPNDPLVLQRLPGIGWNTAAAIVCYAYNRPVPFIETNVRRVLLHYIFPEQQNVSDRMLLPHAVALLDHDRPREWHWALMDHGTYLAKTVPNPNRRSAHHTVQSPFATSVRRVRGQIVRLLNAHGALEVAELAAYSSAPPERFTAAIAALEREGICYRDSLNVVRVGSPPAR